ncbi:maleylpyruvate isomerase family mycothiol-dependent enzyme [Dactylosporangium aurantiacum]|uniref:Maleylpyruvate isomerase family mycothiol-dependent enzyme n=1 Tax=Dactylosporangium aurantiacum TaxID=35754 RepID=A0A9Q9IAS7_9ACTN|nr:maleylpyruvate isomerase family mycothiol-dependent enzyme [Dactylosporangium aurantiacum]MDG6101847.1 maleylpyruvate isomerase family mycothiol-dependent enzyme [Dactylosporangium aurantiacum]UWZ52351.1 maleylpyruvate isomerase family mycothiol-dependent enzyme [Dactylosporangium aurantiacum]
MDESYWSAVQAMRLRVADLLETIEPAEWDAPSLCEGWRVRDVAGHLVTVPTITTWDLIATAPRARGNVNRMNTLTAVRAGAREPGELVAGLRRHAGDRRTAAVLDTRNALFDVVVHYQDIGAPLGRPCPVPVGYTARGLDRVWRMGWPFNARRRLAGVTLRATDTPWTVGAGPEVAGPALSLLLLLTGRTAVAAPTLEGPGLATVTARAA